MAATNGDAGGRFQRVYGALDARVRDVDTFPDATPPEVAVDDSREHVELPSQ